MVSKNISSISLFINNFLFGAAGVVYFVLNISEHPMYPWLVVPADANPFFKYALACTILNMIGVKHFPVRFIFFSCTPSARLP